MSGDSRAGHSVNCNSLSHWNKIGGGPQTQSTMDWKHYNDKIWAIKYSMYRQAEGNEMDGHIANCPFTACLLVAAKPQFPKHQPKFSLK